MKFLGRLNRTGDYRGHISLVYPGTIPGAVNTLGGGRRSGRADPPPAAGGRGGWLRWGRRPAPAVGRTVASSGSRQDGQPSASAASRAGAGDTMPRRPGQEIPCRAGAQAQRRPSTARAASPPPAPPASRPQEIPNARAREDTTTRRPARNSKRARARYWRRGSRPLRVRKRKIFLGMRQKNRFRGAGAEKMRVVKNAAIGEIKESSNALKPGQLHFGGKGSCERPWTVCA